ncbi:MAG TPA: hypothetical protein VFE82_13770 [Ramlibacter sp.]|jgi:hypothetical protein|uniref:hypothetical protein n=1 Tax=Ramlibacter sp. TaxID=1917967 RepID=UPI002D6534FE|nr:hypothetical protein [Ramlibacter sp.]HZY19539.1 hypothetical protein [Ramlibacter sp.]
MNFRQAALGALALVAAGQAAACYTVYDRNNKIVYNAQKPPVDMSRPLSETLPARFPGGHLVFDNGSSDCPADNQPRSQLQTAVDAGRSPLLTDASTATSMGLPHTPLGNGVVMVPNRPATMRPGVVLADSIPNATAIAAPSTAAMGAGPAPQQRPAAAQVAPTTTPANTPPWTSGQSQRKAPASR